MDTNLPVQHYIDKQMSLREHRFVDWIDVIKGIPTNSQFEGAYVGSFSLTYANRQATLVGKHHDWCGKPVSASSISRLILRDGLKLLGRKRIFWNMKSKPLLDIPQPLYCKPLELGGRLTYVDIRRAYHTIYSRLPLDIRFQGLRAYGGRVWFRDFIPPDLCEYPLVRNSLVGCLRQLTQMRIKNGKTNVTPNRNIFLSPEHWGFITHLLHGIAHCAIRYNARYFNTDGAIFTRDEDAIAYCQQLAEWGFIPHIKAQGTGSIYSVGNYKIGEENAGCRNPKPLEFNNLIEPSPYILKRWIEWN